MEIIFYKMKDEKNRVDKNIQEYYAWRFEGDFKTSVSIMDAVIDITLFDEEGFDSFSITEFNYCYCVKLKRFYFINSIDIVRKNFYRFYCHEDVLTSFKDTLQNSKFFCYRSHFLVDKFIVDNEIQLKTNHEITERYLPYNDYLWRGDMPNLENGGFSNFLNENNYNIALNVTLPNKDLGSYITFPQGNPSLKLSTSSPYVNGTAYNSITYVLKYSQLVKVLGKIYEKQSLSSYIKSIVVYPFEIPKIEKPTDWTFLDAYDCVLLGQSDKVYTGSQVYILKDTSPYTYHCTINRIDSARSYLDYEPYSKYELFIPYVDWINVPYDLIQGKSLVVDYVVDFANNQAIVDVYATDSNEKDNNLNIVYQSDCKLGCQIGVDTTNAFEIENQRKQALSNLIFGTINGALNMVGSMSNVSNPIQATRGGLSNAVGIAQTGFNYILQDRAMTLSAKGQISSGSMSLYSTSIYPVLRKTSVITYLNDNDGDIITYPCNKIGTIAQLKNLVSETGLGLCKGEIHTSNLEISFDERQEIESLFATGVIIGER